MAKAYISDQINVRKHARYLSRSNSGTILLHPARKMNQNRLVIELRLHYGMCSQQARAILIPFQLLNFVIKHISY